MGRIVVAGGSMGGLRAAEQLRKQGWTGELVVVGEEAHLPYNRPPLSKELLRDMAALAGADDLSPHLASVAFRLRDSVGDVEWRLGTPVASADLDARVVTLASGERLAYDGLVVATGLRPRRLPHAGPRAGRHVVRTIDDAALLRSALGPDRRVVVVGAGFIGCEVAATARALGCRVTVVEPMLAPMEAALGRELGAALQRHHERNGVEFRLGRIVAAIGATTDPDRVGAVVLDDGTRIETRAIIESVGSHPNVEWLEGNDLDLSDGVLCDNWLRVEGRDDVVAVGDVARFPNPLYGGRPQRVEHWAMPTDTAKRAARTLVCGIHRDGLDPEPFAPLPTFWSDQFGLRINAVGSPAAGDRSAVIEGELGADGRGLESGVAVGYYDGERLVGVVTVGLPPARSMRFRAELVGSERVA